MNDESNLNDAIRAGRALLENPYAFLNEAGSFDSQPYSDVRRTQIVAMQIPAELSRGTFKSIAQMARDLQRDIWRHRNSLGLPQLASVAEIVEPSIAAKLLGVDMEVVSGLGSMFYENRQFEVAGLIDRQGNRIKLSRRLSPRSRRFTGAHEIGHFLLHAGTAMHRDRPIDGMETNIGAKDPLERQADYFAAHLLMPPKVLRDYFFRRFDTDEFEFNIDTCLKLNAHWNSLQAKSKVDHLASAKVLASAEIYAGQKFESLADEFRVSITSMAIQLKDIGLIRE